MEFRSLIAHPSSPRTLYVASKADIFVTTNDGTNWRPFDSGLPKVEIKNIVYDGYLYAATKMRGLWRTRLPLNPFIVLPGALQP